jgi:NADH:ubiquinone oxidoreductase subunit E
MNEPHVTEPIPNSMQSQPGFAVPAALEAEIDELITHYPVKRSASLMLLHAIQDHFGWLSQEAVEWTAKKLGLSPINIYELVTFYPMFRQQPMGKFQIKVCRTLSCALGGAYELHKHFCNKLGLDAQARSANDEGRKVHGRICRMPRRLWHRPGDDGQRRLPRRRQSCEGGRTCGQVQ